MRRVHSIAAIGVLIVGPWTLAADRTDVPGEPDPAAMTERLRADSFADRQEATLALRRAGLRGIAALIDAAKGEDADARQRALDVLEQHLREGDPNLQTRAKQALEQLAQGDGPAGRAARRVLNPPAAPAQDPRRRMAGIQILRAAQARIQLPRAPVPVGARSISISISENGRSIRIQKKDDEIRIEITETRDGQKVVEKFEAKNVDELKADHPRGFEFYEKVAPRFGLPLPSRPEPKPVPR